MAKTLQRLFFASITKHTGPVERGMQVPPQIFPGIEVKPVILQKTSNFYGHNQIGKPSNGPDIGAPRSAKQHDAS